MAETIRYSAPKKIFKMTVIKIILFILRRGMKAGSKMDPDIKKECIQSFPDGYSIALKIWPDGPQMTIVKKNNSFVHGKKYQDNPDLSIYYKNLESAYMAFTAQIGIPKSLAEHRILARGDTVKVMAFVRCMIVLQRHLFPWFLARKVLRTMPQMGFKKQMIRLYIYFIGIPFGI
ncbi:MAG: hypothetical protein OEZ36_00865 [Spirochaetota bacterium]|nr:hypothetical protein [Spirochaetota bacterium]